MESLNLLFIAMSCLLASVSISLSEEVKDDEVQSHCQSETFQPRCLKNEVIMMKSATYGRMRIGRCITAAEVDAQRSLAGGDDPRILGCSADVLPFLDRKCSGKNACEVRVFDISDENVRPCLHGLNVYLEASYSCVAVVDEERSCVVSASSNPVHILASRASGRVCGTVSKPWIAEAPPGQKLKISLFDFSTSSQDYNQRPPKQPCLNYGLIVERAAKINTTICRIGEQREKDLHISTGNTVEIILNIPEEKESITAGENYIIKLQAVGCSDIIPPEDAWLKRKDDVIVIGCYSNRQTWHLNCRGRKWEGVLGNCSQETLVHERVVEQEPLTQLSTNGQVLAIVAISGFTVAICLTIMCLGLVCLRRFYAQSKRKQNYKTLDYHHFNSSNGQQQTSDVATTLGQTDEPRLQSQVMPTYSVYVAETDLVDPVGAVLPTRIGNTCRQL